MIVVDDNIESAEQKTNNYLQKIYEYTNENKLMLNAEKSKWMILRNKYTNNAQIKIHIGGKELENVQKMKYLGVIIDNELKFDAHIDFIQKKTASKIGYFKRISKKLTQKAKIIACASIVMPNINYCSTLQIACNKEQINALQKLQNRAMRIILKCDYLTPINFMLNELKWLSINQRIVYNVILMIFMMKNDLAPKYLTKKLMYANEIHGRNTRNMVELRLPKYKKESTRKSLYFRGVQLYNQINRDMKEETNVNRFKRKLYEYVKQNDVNLFSNL